MEQTTNIAAEYKKEWVPVVYGGSRWLFVFFAIFGAFGIGILYFGYTLAQETLELKQHGISTTGRVEGLEYRSDSEGGGAYYPHVRFTAQDRQEYEFTNDNGSNPASFDVGEEVAVLYLPEAPHRASIDAFFSLWVGPIICGVMGLIFAGIGCGGFFYYIVKTRQNKRLLTQGRRIVADVAHIERPRDKQTYYAIHAQWHNPQDGKMYLFTSEPLAFDPEHYVEETIEILIDPHRPSRYVMDTSFLPKVA